MKRGKIIKKEAEQRGITLIALVITVIIMLILAGVTLNMALGENGLFQMARNGGGAYKEAADKEDLALQQGSEEIANVLESLKGPETIDDGELTTNPKKYYGEYVNYGVDLDGDENTIDWKLFYVGGTDTNDSDDVKGMIYLIAADYVPMENETLKAAMEDKDNGARMFPSRTSGYGALSANWGSSAPAYQPLDGLSPDPIELFMHTGYTLSSKSGNPNSAATSTLLNTANWAGFAKGKYGYAAIGGPTVEMWCKAWNAVVDEEDGFRKVYPNGNKTSGDGYYVGADANQTSTYYYITKSGSSFNTTEKDTIAKNYNVFFPQTELSVTANGVKGNCYGYWLASPSAGDTNYVLGVGYYGIVSGGTYRGTYGNGLRPVVCLQSGVKLQKNTAKSDDTKTVYDIVK